MFKVHIQGINTAELKTLKNDEMMELIVKSQAGDEAAREKMVIGNLKLILSVLKKFHNRKEDPDDLFQVGTIGLMKAIDNFDMSHGVRFSTYAVPMIIGEIRRYLRDNNSIRVSRSLKDTAYKILMLKDRYIKEYSREPNMEEITRELGVSEIDVIMSLEAVQDTISIYTPIYNEGGDEISLLDQINGYDTLERDIEVEDMILFGLKKLEKRERDILYDRYFKNRTQMEIAEEMGISQAQVSRLEKSALKNMKTHIQA